MSVEWYRVDVQRRQGDVLAVIISQLRRSESPCGRCGLEPWAVDIAVAPAETLVDRGIELVEKRTPRRRR